MSSVIFLFAAYLAALGIIGGFVIYTLRELKSLRRDVDSFSRKDRE